MPPLARVSHRDFEASAKLSTGLDCAGLFTLHADDAAQAGINLCWLHRRRAESDAGQCDQVTPWYASRGAEIIAALAPLRRPPTRQSVAPLPEDAAAKFFLVRGLHNLFLLSAHDHEAITSARGDAKETQRS